MPKTCLWCTNEFSPDRDWQKFCCREHQQAWHRHERKRAEVAAAEQRSATLRGLVNKIAENKPIGGAPRPGATSTGIIVRRI
jgi:hypothetical protein